MSNLKARAQSSSSRRENFSTNQAPIKQPAISNVEKVKSILKENIHTTGKKKFHFSGKCLSRITKAKEPLVDNSNSTFRSEDTLGGKSESSQVFNPQKDCDSRLALQNLLDWEQSNSKTNSKSVCDHSLLDIVLSAKQGTVSQYPGTLITPIKNEQIIQTPLRPIEEENISIAHGMLNTVQTNDENIQSIDFMGSLNNSFSPNLQHNIMTNGFLENTVLGSEQNTNSKAEANSGENLFFQSSNNNSYSKMRKDSQDSKIPNFNTNKEKGPKVRIKSQESFSNFSQLPTPGDSAYPPGRIPPLLSTIHHARIHSMKSINQQIRRNLELSDFNKEGIYQNYLYNNIKPATLFTDMEGSSELAEIRRYMDRRFSNIEKRLESNENLIKLSEEILILKREAESKSSSNHSEEKKWNEILLKISGLEKRISKLEQSTGYSNPSENSLMNHSEASAKFEIFTQKILQSLLGFSEKLKELSRRQQQRNDEKESAVKYINSVEKDLESRIKAVLDENISILKFESEQQTSGFLDSMKNLCDRQISFEQTANEKWNAVRRLEDDFLRIVDDNLKLHEKLNSIKFLINDQQQSSTSLTRKLMNI